MDVAERVDNEVFEPLAETAPFARAMAAQCCDPAVGCAPYHGVWQYLRLLGVNTTIQTDRPFFVGQFRALARNGCRRVLISGSADYGMLAQLAHAFRAEGIEPEVVFVDRCATAVAVNADFARRAGLSLETVRGDILAVDVAAVDIVCTHSFLNFFPAAARPDLVGAWRRMLRPGGAVVTSTAIWEAGGAPADHRSPQRTEAIRLQVLAAARAAGSPIAPMAEALAADVVTMRERQASHPSGTRDQLRLLLTDAGFRVDHLGADAETATGRSLFGQGATGRSRVQVLATRIG